MADVLFSDVPEKTLLDGSELFLGASSGDETAQQKFSRNVINAQNGFVNVKDYGAVGDGATDDLAAINAAVTAANALDRAYVYFPSLGEADQGYLVSSTVVLPPATLIWMDGPCKATFNDRAIIQHGTSGVANRMRGAVLKLQAWFNHTDWSNPAAVCIQFFGSNRTANIEIPYTSGGYCGLKLTADAAVSFVGYNRFNIGYMQDHKYAIQMYQVGVGWINQNFFQVNYVRCNSNVNPGQDRAAIHVDNDGTQVINTNNSNYWIGPGFELEPPGSEEAILLDAKDIANWVMVNIRTENNTAEYPLRIHGTFSRLNSVSFIHAESAQGADPDFNTSMPTRPVVLIDTGRIEEKGRRSIFKSGVLQNTSGPHTDQYGYYLRGLAGMDRFTQVVTSHSAGLPLADYFITIHDIILFTRIKFLSGPRTLYLTKKSPTGVYKRKYIKTYDSTGTLIDGAVDTTPSVLFGSWIPGTLGGVWQEGNDETLETQSLQFRGNNSAGEEPVVFVDILWSNTNGELTEVEVEAPVDSVIDHIPMAPTVNWGAVTTNIGEIVPYEGDHNRGEVVANILAATGQPSGWVCTVSGAPGTWVPLPDIPV